MYYQNPGPVNLFSIDTEVALLIIIAKWLILCLKRNGKMSHIGFTKYPISGSEPVLFYHDEQILSVL